MLIAACAAVVGWFVWRRWQSSRDQDGKDTSVSSERSAFKFPSSKVRSTNPKKNRAARRADKARRKEERELAT